MKIRYEISTLVFWAGILLILGILFSIRGLQNVGNYQNAILIEELAESKCKEGVYVTGEIDSYLLGGKQGYNDDMRSGQSAVYVDFLFGESYVTYNVPMANNRYIRVLVCEKETIEGLENMLSGTGEKVPFQGVITESEPLIDTEWYTGIPNFNTADIIQTVALKEMDIKGSQNVLYIGIMLLLAAVFLYWKSGGIKKTEVLVQPLNNIHATYANSYNKQYQLDMEGKRLAAYRQRKHFLRKWCIAGWVIFALGIYIVIIGQFFEFQIIGIFIMLLAGRYIWDDFIHSNSKVATWIAKIMHMKTLQDDIRDCEERIRVLTQLMQEDAHEYI